jgi:hypothetical protein
VYDAAHNEVSGLNLDDIERYLNNNRGNSQLRFRRKDRPMQKFKGRVIL